MNSELRRGIYLSHRYGGTQRLVNRLEHRLVASLLRRLPRPLRILDIPSGYGRFTPQLEDAAATPLVCSDVDHRRLAVLGPTESVPPSAPFCVLADLTGPLPFASGVFDLVFNFRYFHHVGDPQQRRDTLAELVRISRRYLIVSYYNRPLIHVAVKKLQYLPRRPRRRTADMVPSREFKRLFQTLGCRVLADRAILPGLHAQRVALVEKVNSIAPTVTRPAPPSAVWVGVVALLLHLTSGCGHRRVPAVGAAVETEPLLRMAHPPHGRRSGDADDPAIWVHPTDPSLSLVLGTLKSGGLDVYDLDGQLLQTINPGNVLYNNVDVMWH